MPKAMTLPARTPSTAAAARSTSSGNTLRPADDDHVLEAAAHHQLAVDQVAEVAGAQPAVVEGRRGRVGLAVVAGRHRRARGSPTRRPPARPRTVAGDRVDDPDLEAGDGPPEQGQSRRARVARRRRGGQALGAPGPAGRRCRPPCPRRARGTSRRASPRPCRRPGSRPGSKPWGRAASTKSRPRPGRRARRRSARAARRDRSSVPAASAAAPARASA